MYVFCKLVSSSTRPSFSCTPLIRSFSGRHRPHRQAQPTFRPLLKSARQVTNVFTSRTNWNQYETYFCPWFTPIELDVHLIIQPHSSPDVVHQITATQECSTHNLDLAVAEHLVKWAATTWPARTRFVARLRLIPKWCPWKKEPRVYPVLFWLVLITRTDLWFLRAMTPCRESTTNN